MNRLIQTIQTQRYHIYCYYSGDIALEIFFHPNKQHVNIHLNQAVNKFFNVFDLVIEGFRTKSNGVTFLPKLS